MKSERGISLILAAFSLVLGLWGLLTFAWLPLVHRNAKLELQVLADAACGGVSIDDSPGVINQIPFQLQMWGSFRGKFNEPEGRYVTVQQATLFLATPPDNPGTLYSPAPGLESGEPSSVADWNGGQGRCFQDGVSRLVASLERDVNCGPGYADLADVLPFAGTNNIRNFGNTAVCHLRGVVRNELFGISLDFLEMGGEDERELQVVSGFWAPVRGINSSPPLEAPPMDATNSPGLLIAIAPQLRALDSIADWTDLDNRFRFPTGHEFRDNDEFDIEQAPNCSNLSAGATGPRFSFSCNPNLSLENSGEFLPQTDIPASPNEMRAKRYGCLNPLILARNMFTSALTSLAARHGQLRGRTDMLLVNSRVDGSTAFSAPPAVLLEENSDILNSTFSPPYNFIRGYELTAGVPQQLSPVFAYSLVTGSSALERYATSQLAQCSHVYSGLEGAPTFSNFLQTRLMELNLGFNGAYNFYRSEPDLRGVNSLVNLVWEPDAFGFQSTAISKPLPLHAAVSSMMIGAVRYCPFYGFAGTRCEDIGARGGLELAPDLVGLFSFLSDRNGRAIRRDRIGIVRRTEAPETDDAVTRTRGDPYNFPLTALIMHDIPNNIVGLATAIDAYSSPLGFPDSRPIHVVVIPSGPVSGPGLQAFEQAIGSADGFGRQFLNSVTVIQPCEVRADVSGSNDGAPRYPAFCDVLNGEKIDEWYGEENFWRSFWLALAGEAVLPGGNRLPEADTAYGRALEFFRTKVTRASSFF